MAERSLATVPPRYDAGTAVAARPQRPSLALPTPDEWAMLKELGTAYVQSGLLPGHLKTWQAVVACMRFGQQLGVDEWTALQDTYFINGKAACSSGLMQALIQRDHGGDAIVPVEVTPEGVTIRYKRVEWPEYRTHTFTIAMARAAGLVLPNSNWVKWPGPMCFARCLTQIAKMCFADTARNMKLPDELGAPILVQEDGSVVLDTAHYRAPETVVAEPIEAETRPIAEADAGLDWTGFWRWAKGQGLDKAAIERVTMRPMTELAPAKVKQMLEHSVLADRPGAPAQAATNGDPAKSPRQVAGAALFAHVRDRMKRDPSDRPDGHAGVKALQSYLYEDEPNLRDASISDESVWTEEELRRFRSRVATMDPSDFAMVVTSEDDGPGTVEVEGRTVDAETGEIVGAVMTEREQTLAAWSEMAESARERGGGALWHALLNDPNFAPKDLEVWERVIREADTPETVNVLRAWAGAKKVRVPELDGLLNERAKAVRQAMETAAP